jgi:hypothetical protein
MVCTKEQCLQNGLKIPAKPILLSVPSAVVSPCHSVLAKLSFKRSNIPYISPYPTRFLRAQSWPPLHYRLSSTLNTVAADFSETLVTLYQITRRHVPQDTNLYNRRCESIRNHLHEEVNGKRRFTLWNFTTRSYSEEHHPSITRKRDVHGLRTYYTSGC